MSRADTVMTYHPRENPTVISRIKVDGKMLSHSGDRFRLQGVTYGPFAPDLEGFRFPNPEQVRVDFELMADHGVNTVRVYELPPAWLLEQAAESQLPLLIDIPWFKNHCFLDDAASIRDIRNSIKSAVKHCRDTRGVLGYCVGNEIRPDLVRWHSARKVEKFLAELGDVVKQEDPDALTTYANYPPTEYLDTSSLDFATFNVYLHDPATFRKYLYRLQNLVGERPLILGEIGMDTLRHPEAEQAEFLTGHLRDAVLIGLAGSYVFSWTDEWFTGGQFIDDWAFGITTSARSPKPALSSVAEIFSQTPAELLNETPRVSVVVCSYNGGRTLTQCLESLRHVDYPNYEVILVDDGSTDNTREIAANFPEVHSIHQPNLGLSEARNVGLRASTGSIIAYTDSDCFVATDWLALLVAPLLDTDAAAVGGPNLTPDDGWLAACVAASPGQPTHVLENDQTAEHIPGCNMAFRRDALEEINGFLPHYRKAGDDVDLCWRIQQSGRWITFAPGAFVWHHRRQDPQAYLKQQRGYGEAEALLWFDHPDHFNERGEGKWRGTLYGGALKGLRLGRAVIYRGVFAAGMFQTIYQPDPSHWTMAPVTLEWHLTILLLILLAFASPAVWIVVGLMATASVSVSAIRAIQASVPRRYDGWKARLTIMCLSHAQPLVRTWARYKGYFLPPRTMRHVKRNATDDAPGVSTDGKLVVGYWDQTCRTRMNLLDPLTKFLRTQLRPMRIDAGWSDWDFQVFPNTWHSLQIETVQEGDHAGNGLFRISYRLRPSGQFQVLAVVLLVLIATLWQFDFYLGLLGSILSITILVAGWWRGRKLTRHVISSIDEMFKNLGLMRCEVGPRVTKGWNAHVE